MTLNTYFRSSKQIQEKTISTEYPSKLSSEPQGVGANLVKDAAQYSNRPSEYKLLENDLIMRENELQFSSMASKHYTSSSAQTQIQSRERDSHQNFGNQVHQYEKVSSSKRRTPHGFDPRVGNKHEVKTSKNTVTESDVISANELQHHNSPYVSNVSDANLTKDNVNSKTLTYSSAHKSKSHAKRARNRSLEMVIDDDKADSSPSRSRYITYEHES